MGHPNSRNIIPGLILSCLDLNWTESVWLNRVYLIEPSLFDWTESVWLNRVKIAEIGHFLVQFGLNLGLNNLIFGQEAIFDQIDSIEPSQFDWTKSIWLYRVDLNLIMLNDRNEFLDKNLKNKGRVGKTTRGSYLTMK